MWNEFLLFLDRWGINYTFYPFIILLPTIYLVLLIISMLRNRVIEDVKLNIYLSLGISLLLVLPNMFGLYPAGYDLVAIINNALPFMSFFIFFPFLVINILQKGAVYTFLAFAVRKYWNSKEGIKTGAEFQHKRGWGIYILCAVGFNAFVGGVMIFGHGVMPSVQSILVFLITLITGIYMVK